MFWRIISRFLRLLRFNHISYIGKLRIIYALIIIKFKKNLKDLDSTDFKTWLKKHHQTYETNKYFWELFLKPALNDELEYSYQLEPGEIISFDVFYTPETYESNGALIEIYSDDEDEPVKTVLLE